MAAEGGGGSVSGHFIFTDSVTSTKAVKLEVWLQNDKSFKIHYEEKEANSYVINEEEGTYQVEEDTKIKLTTIKRDWKWGDDSESDSGTDVTDLVYPAQLKPNELQVTYLEVPYVLKKVE